MGSADVFASREELIEELLSAGSRLIDNGKPIIPCDGKIPCGPNGRPANDWQNLPITVERLEAGLRGTQQPANGIIIGPPSGIIDVETDSQDEVEAVRHLFRDVDPVITVAYRSPRGRHDWFRYDPRLEPIGKAVFQYKAPKGKSVKIRLGLGAKASQSIIPPSTGREWLPGLSYDECDIAPLPEVVIQRLLEAAQDKSIPPGNPSLNGRHGGCLNAMRTAVKNMQDGSDGSKRLFTYCCRGVEHNATDEEVVAFVAELEKERPFPKSWKKAEIVARIRDAEKAVQRGSAIIIANYTEVEVETEKGKAPKIVSVPKTMTEIIAEICRQTGNWPRRVDSMLFVDDSEHGLSYFDRRGTSGLFGWLRSRFSVKWAKGGDYVAQAELFAEVERQATRYEGVEILPHYPAVGGVYYRGERPKLGDGSHLAWLLDRFRPETTIDRDLIQAAFMTPAWGGPPGRRPAFVITSDDGRGVGKSTVAELVGYLYLGVVDVSAGEDIQTLKTRLLSGEARTKRVALLDNVKTLRLSWAELEALITSPIISGRQLFVGEGQRPNLLTWFLTLNGVSMATDMAQRSVIIKVIKGENDGPWYEETTRYIDQHRSEIIGDILAALQGERFELASYSRWATWEKDVLCRLPEPAEAQRVIIERQGEVNCELDEAEIIEQFFAERLEHYGYDPTTAQVRIPVATAAFWFSEAIGERMKTAAASKRIHQMATERQLKRLAPDKSRAHGRGFIYTGPQADIFNIQIDNDLGARIAQERNERRDRRDGWDG